MNQWLNVMHIVKGFGERLCDAQFIPFTKSSSPGLNTQIKRRVIEKGPAEHSGGFSRLDFKRKLMGLRAES